MSFIDRNASRFLGRSVLSNDELRSLAPSIFATDRHESRSERYSYIPTSEIVDGMRANGFEPMFAKQGNSRVEGKAAYNKHLIRFRHQGEDVATRKRRRLLSSRAGRCVRYDLHRCEGQPHHRHPIGFLHFSAAAWSADRHLDAGRRGATWPYD